MWLQEIRKSKQNCHWNGMLARIRPSCRGEVQDIGLSSRQYHKQPWSRPVNILVLKLPYLLPQASSDARYINLVVRIGVDKRSCREKGTCREILSLG